MKKKNTLKEKFRKLLVCWKYGPIEFTVAYRVQLFSNARKIFSHVHNGTFHEFQILWLVFNVTSWTKLMKIFFYISSQNFHRYNTIIYKFRRLEKLKNLIILVTFIHIICNRCTKNDWKMKILYHKKKLRIKCENIVFETHSLSLFYNLYFTSRISYSSQNINAMLCVHIAKRLAIKREAI